MVAVRRSAVTASEATSQDAPATHALASRQRRDAVSGVVMPEARLIRFVLSPEGAVTPDVARKLPGRGVWVEATRAAVEQAAKRGAFARSLKVKASAPADLAAQVERLLRARALAGLGLARRSRAFVSGFEKVVAAVEGGRASWLVEAADGAEDGRRKLLAIARRAAAPPPVIGVFDNAELSVATGGENVIHGAFLAGRAAERWTEEVRRLEGFRPLLPDHWDPSYWNQGSWREGH